MRKTKDSMKLCDGEANGDVNKKPNEGANGVESIGIWGSERICAYIDYLVGELWRKGEVGEG